MDTRRAFDDVCEVPQHFEQFSPQSQVGPGLTPDCMGILPMNTLAEPTIVVPEEESVQNRSR